MKPEDPIGIFDSGIGGLTIARSVLGLLPKESIIFFGDTAHLPYGDKSSESIRSYSETIVNFLFEQGCKAVIIACNTASAAAYRSLKSTFKGRIILNVVDPVVQLAVSKSPEKIGVIGTKGTIRSNVYPRRIKSLNKKIKTATLATPLLAPMIEEGFFNNNISQTIINSYLSKKHMQGISELILACTHYPLIKPEIEQYYKKKVHIIDSTDVVAAELKKILDQKNVLNLGKQKPTHKFYVSDYTNSFKETTHIFFEKKVDLKHFPIWKEGSN